MTYIHNSENNYAIEYQKFGEKILAENKEILKKAGVVPQIFNADTKTENSSVGLVVEKKHDDKNKKYKKEQQDDSENIAETVFDNKTISEVKSSKGILNTILKETIRAAGYAQNRKDSEDTSVDKSQEFMSYLKETNGKDDNDDLENFICSEYEDGLHINGGGYAYYETCSDSSTEATSANFAGTYKSKNKKLTLSYGGSFEYSKNIDKKESEQKTVNSNSNAIFMAKYKAKDMIYAGGGSANIYDNDSKLYNIYAGTMHKSGLSATLVREIQVTLDEFGERVINNRTNVKLNILKPKKAGNPSNIIPEIPSPEKTKELDNLVSEDKQEVNNIANTQGYGLGLNLELATSNDADEYGVELTYPSLLTKKDDQTKKIAVTPFLGVYDYHPSTNEGLKIRAGVLGALEYNTNSNINISSTAIIDNKRIMQPGSQPANMFMTTLDTNVSKNKFAATVSAGYINSNMDIDYLFVTGNLEYKMKKSKLSMHAGYQVCNMDDSKDEICHLGVGYELNF